MISTRTLEEHRTHKKDMKASYHAVFDSPVGVDVLEDLRDFCGMDADAFADDAAKTAYNLGMRRVFLYIQHTMNLSNEELPRKEGRHDSQ